MEEIKKQIKKEMKAEHQQILRKGLEGYLLTAQERAKICLFCNISPSKTKRVKNITTGEDFYIIL